MTVLISFGKTQGLSKFNRQNVRRREDNIKMDVRDVGVGIDWLRIDTRCGIL
jgi:hypothetical protein